MAVYVDELRKTNKRWCREELMYCHLFADNENELHLFALEIGLRRSWFQDKRYSHYDLTPSKRLLAVSKGAVEVKTKEYLKGKM